MRGGVLSFGRRLGGGKRRELMAGTNTRCCCGPCDSSTRVISIVSEGGKEGDASLGLGSAVGSRL